MIISDLNHLESVSTTEVFGGGRSSKKTRSAVKFDVYVDKNVDIKIEEYVDVFKTLDTASYVIGNSAIAEADASASGYATSAEAFSFTYTTDYFSSAGATSISQSD